MSNETQVAFDRASYMRIIKPLDEVIEFMKTRFGKTEQEARDWMKDFVLGHYFPVWRAMNSDDK
jgi:hypothetical protein